MSQLSETRHCLIEALAELSQMYPDMRFGQLICMVSHVGGEPKVFDAYDVEDGDMLHHVLKLIARSEVSGATSYRLVEQSVVAD